MGCVCVKYRLVSCVGHIRVKEDSNLDDRLNEVNENSSACTLNGNQHVPFTRRKRTGTVSVTFELSVRNLFRARLAYCQKGDVSCSLFFDSCFQKFLAVTQPYV